MANNTNSMSTYRARESLGLFLQKDSNQWLSSATVQIGRKDTTIYGDRAVVGVTDGNLHLDAYQNKGLYLNWYSSAGNIYFNGSTYYINGGYYNGNSASANRLASSGTIGQFWRGDNTWSNTLEGNLIITSRIYAGIPNGYNFPTGCYNIYDIRGSDFRPDKLSYAMNLFFSNTPAPNPDWSAGFYIRGWNGSDYAGWCLVGPATNGDMSSQPLYVRTSKNASTWGSYRKIYDTSNKPTPSEIGALASGGKAVDSDKLDGIDSRGFLRVYLNYADLSNFDTVGLDNYLYSHSDTGNMCSGTLPSGAHNGTAILNTHSHSGNYSQQIAFDTNNNAIWYRNANNTSSFTAWQKILASNNYTSYTVTKTGGGASGTWGISISGNATTATTASNANYATYTRYVQSPDTRSTNPAPTSYSATYGVSFDFKQGSVIGLNTASYSGVMTYRPYASGSDWSGGNAHRIAFNNAGLYWQQGNSSWGTWYRIWKQGDAVTSAVWNDYAECRTADTDEPGYVFIENGDDTLSKSTERLQSFAGISSDTWGFSEGETETAKTHIAVAGRVLAYTFRPREEYKPGDCVCTAPNGTVDIMTREEIIQWPDKIVGTVSCVPDYEEWGGGKDANREPVKVNGRIWIKVK